MLNKDNDYYTEVSVTKMFTSHILKQQRGTQFLSQHKTQKYGSPLPLVGIWLNANVGKFPTDSLNIFLRFP